jgi:hypothetical protein
MRAPARRQVLTSRGEPVGRTEGAERTETLVEGDPETLLKPDRRLPPCALQHAPEGPTSFEAACSQGLIARSCPRATADSRTYQRSRLSFHETSLQGGYTERRIFGTGFSQKRCFNEDVFTGFGHDPHHRLLHVIMVSSSLYTISSIVTVCFQHYMVVI